MQTEEAITAVYEERQRQLEIGTDGELTNRNDLIATAVAYLGRAASGVHRNEREGHNPQEMLIKAAAVIVDAIERS